MRRVSILAPLLIVAVSAQTPTPIDWKAVADETLRHYQALVRFDTSDPPGNERPAADYVRSVL